MAPAHTPGPWRWELNETTRFVHLVGGKPQWDLTIIEPVRWGMNGGTLQIRDTAHDGMNIMHKLHERRDWITPFPGREHHASWLQGVTHPDMRLIEAAPDLLVGLQGMFELHEPEGRFQPSHYKQPLGVARAALLKATGQDDSRQIYRAADDARFRIDELTRALRMCVTEEGASQEDLNRARATLAKHGSAAC